MKIRADHVVQALPEGPAQALARLRRLRGFDAPSWVAAKVDAMIDYWRQHGLSGAVLGVSGGIDSAVAAGLLARMAQAPDTPLKRWHMLAMPAVGDAGVSGQAEALARARTLGEALGVPVGCVDVAPSVQSLQGKLHVAMGIQAQSWASGQGVAVSRTLALYQAASLLAQEGFPALVVGTTNRDEGAYLGYVGKAADGMVDVQVISDLHKSEVYAVALHLGIPSSLVSVVPTGDMFDACPDTDVFGAPYDAVELLLLARTLWAPGQWEEERQRWSTEDRAVWARAQANLEALHGYNAHKYKVGSPAVHLDVLASAAPGGWHPSNPQPWRPPATSVSSRPAPRALPGGCRLDWVRMPSGDEAPALDVSGLRLRVPGLLTAPARHALLEALDAGPWQAADAHGQWREGIQRMGTGPHGGSWRTTVEDPAWAAALWCALQSRLPAFRRWGPMSRFEGAEASVWRPVGVNPVFRVIRYEAGGWLVPHYDGPFEMDARRRTGMSLVMYLESEDSLAGDAGGALRFLRDPQANLPLADCRFEDWTRQPEPQEVELVAQTNPGDAWVFDHRILHDSSLLVRGRKTLVRTDIVFERVGV